MDKLPYDQTQLVYQDQGEGNPIVLLHAGVADHRMWHNCIDSLLVKHRVITLDLPGFGESLLPNNAFAYYEVLARLLDHCDIEQATLIGTSFGGELALDFALHFPQRVEKLILLSPAASGFKPENEVKVFGGQEDELLEQGKLEAASRLNVDMWLVGPKRTTADVDEALQDLVFNMQLAAFKQPEPEGVALKPNNLVALDNLLLIQCPVSILSGELDVPEFLALGKRLAGGITNSKHILVPDVAHLITLEAPEVLLDVL